MCFMMENKVQDCSGWEPLERSFQAAKAVLIASMQEAARLLATEEELNRCQTLITGLSSGNKSLFVWSPGFSLANEGFFSRYFPFFLP